MKINRLKFNLFLIKNLAFLYVFSVIIILIKYSSYFVLINCWIYLLFSLPVFFFNIYEIRHNKIISYFVFSGLNLIYLICFVTKIFKKETVTRWQDVNGVSVEYTKTYYFYEINSGSVHFTLVCMGVFLVLQFFVWMNIIKKMSQFEIDLE
jgi:hypothetical protein